MHIKLFAAVLAWSIAVLLAAGVARADGSAPHGEAVHKDASGPTNTRCPVMEGNPVDPAIFVTFRGKKVYFCCESCRGKFLDEPEKYLAKLPQFSGSSAAETHAEPAEEGEHAREGGHDHEGTTAPRGFRLSKLIEPLGILTLVLLLSTASTGLLMKRNRKLLFKWHKRIAAVTVVSALCHAALVLLLH